MPVASVDIAIDAACASECGVLQNIAVHLCWLGQVASGVILCRQREGGRGEETETNTYLSHILGLFNIFL